MQHVVSIDVGLRNLAWCIIDVDNGIPASIRQWKVDDMLMYNGSKAKVTNITTDRAIDMVLKYLRDHKSNFDTIAANGVIVGIENQPAGRRGSAKMKCVQTAIYCFFRTLYPSWKTKAVSPSLKLHLHIEGLCRPGSPRFDFTSSATQYVQNKKLAVAKVQHLVNFNDSLNFDTFVTTKNKRDDLADCLLQGLAILNENKRNKNKKVEKRKAEMGIN